MAACAREGMVVAVCGDAVPLPLGLLVFCVTWHESWAGTWQFATCNVV